MAAREIVEGYLHALSSGDVEGTVALVADGFVNEITAAIGAGTNGRDDYRSRLPGFLAQFAALQYEIVDIIAEGDRVSVRYRLTANFNGYPIDIPGVMLFEVRNDLIVRRTDVWDSMTLLRQTRTIDER